jgi:hypothetical protein
MRTTLNLDDYAFQLGKAMAQEQKLTLGETISALILNYSAKQHQSKFVIDAATGWPVSGTKSTSKLKSRAGIVSDLNDLFDDMPLLSEPLANTKPQKAKR